MSDPLNQPYDPSTTAAILRERARELAREAPTHAAAETVLEVVEFGLASERYALAAAAVSEVHPLEELTPVPCTPAFIRGLVNVRGRIFPVIDLKKFFDLPEEGITDLHRILLVETTDLQFGLLADTIAGVHKVPLLSIQPSLPTLNGIRAEYLRGVTADRLVILDAAAILADPRIIVHEEVDN
jgi:purine-binding chemotaxis protein CheW